MKKFALVSLICAFCAVPAVAGPSVGDTVQVEYLNTSIGTTVSVVTPCYTGNLVAGLLDLNVDGTVVQGFCIEFSSLTSDTTVDYTVANLTDATVMGTALTDAQATDIMKVWSWWANSDGSNMSAAVAQCVIWELTDDGNFTTGEFQLNTESVRTQAEALLAALSDMTDYTQLVALTNAECQNFTIPVPAPGAALLASLGLGLISRLRRRNVL